MMYSTNQFYDHISFIYPIINLFLKGQRKVLIDEVNNATPGKLLEIGVGNGSHLPLYINHQITAIDISEAMLNKAKSHECERIRLLLMDGENLLFPEASFDYVVMCHVLAVTKSPDDLLTKVYKVLKPGGKLYILNHFTPNNWLRYVDKAFDTFSSLLHLRSEFYMHNIKGFKNFTLVKKVELGAGSYFKLLIFTKP